MEKFNKSTISIKNWAEDDRPREKLQLKGRHNLSNAELLAILIGSGNKKESAVELAKTILNDVGRDLEELAKLSFDELCSFNGIGTAKAVSILAALELGRRRKASKLIKKKIHSSQDCFLVLNEVLSDLTVEQFWVLYLSRSNSIIEKECISSGGITATLVDVRVLMKKAIQKLACSIIVAHNHPSGNLKPSEQDVKLTGKIKEVGKICDIALLDHLIIGDNKYFSFSDKGYL